MSGSPRRPRKASISARKSIRKLFPQSRFAIRSARIRRRLAQRAREAIYREREAMRSRMLPSRPGQNVDLSFTRSSPDFQLLQRPSSIETLQAQARVGLLRMPQNFLAIQPLTWDAADPVVCPSFTNCFYKVADFREVTPLFGKAVAEQRLEEDAAPVTLLDKIVPYFMPIGYSGGFNGEEPHALGSVWVPAAKTLFIFNSQNRAEQRIAKFVLEDYYEFQLHEKIEVVMLPNQFFDELGIETSFNLQEVCDITSTGLCSYFAFVIPQVMAKEGVFRNLTGTPLENQKEVIRRAYDVQVKQDHPSVSLFNDLKRELGLL